MTKQKTIIILRGRDGGQSFIPGVESLAGCRVLQWARRIGIQDRSVLITDDPLLLTEAQRMGFHIRQTSPRDVWAEITQIAQEMGAKYVIECPINMPFREAWLLEEVESVMLSSHGSRVETASELPGVPGSLKPDGCLVGYPVKWSPSSDSPTVFVRHHAACQRTILTHGDLLGARHWQELADEVAQYPRISKILGTVAIIGGSDSILGSKAGTKIDACNSVVRLHDRREDSVDFGELCDFIFSQDPETINRANDIWPTAKIVSSEWPMPTILRTACTLGVTPDILNSARGTSGIRDYISSGFRAVFWALTNGAKTVLLAGFGGSKHQGSIKADYDKIWRDAENTALDHLAEKGLVQWLD